MLLYILFSTSAAAALALGTTAMLALYPFLPSDLGGAPNLDLRARKVRIPVGSGDALDGWLLAGRRPALVLVFHGYGRNHHRAWRYGAFLQRAGYHVLAVDFRSSRLLRRKPTTLGHFERVDAEATLAWVESQPEFAGLQIAVLGESLGGTVALLLAGSHPQIAAVVADCPFANGHEAVADSVEMTARLPRHPSAHIVRHVARTLTGIDPNDMDAIGAAERLANRPILFIHGLGDARISHRQAERLWRAAGSKDPLWLMPGVGHNQGWLRQTELYEKRVAAFLDFHLFGEGEGVPAGRLSDTA